MRAVTATEMRQIENEAIKAGVSVEELMQRAGRAVADAVGESLEGQIVGRRVLVLAGPGKNGGDGLIAARILAQRGAGVTVALPLPTRHPDLLAECQNAGCATISDPIGEDAHDFAQTVKSADVIIDSLLGTGRSRAIEGPIKGTLDAVAQAEGETLMVAVDVPSGLDSDTGEADESTVDANVTIALGGVKIGCLLADGPNTCGAIEPADIGLLDYAPEELGTRFLSIDHVRRLLPYREEGGFKGRFGKVGVVGGSEKYVGAPVLAGLAATRAGAGIVQMHVPPTIAGEVATLAPELTHFDLRALARETRRAARSWQTVDPNRTRMDPVFTVPDVMVVGPGMGDDRYSETLWNFFLHDGRRWSSEAVLDADALNRLAKVPEWSKQLQVPTIVTPHPGEMARLQMTTNREVQARRVKLADDSAKEWNVTVVLKGAYTVVASPDEPPVICPLAFPALATAGTGDALAGIIAGFLAQGLSTRDAARAGVYVHGLAAVLAAQDNGNMASGLLASDLIEKIPAAMDLIRRGGPAPPPMFA